MALAYERPPAVAARLAWLPSGVAYDWSVALASLWLIAGLHLDGWAHAHRPGLESFFTPWHAVLYSGFFALAALLVAGWVARRPDGYGPSMVGAGIFLVGGVGDMLWHTFLGIEVNVEALLSPTHLTLAVGMALMVTGPLRAAWRARRATLPALVSASLLLSVLTFFTQFIQPGGRPWPIMGNHPTDPIWRMDAVTPDLPVFAAGLPSKEMAIILGVAGILLSTLFVVGVVLPLARRFTLPVGSLTLILGLNAVLLALMRDTLFFIPVALAAGVVGDALLPALRPLRGWRLRAFAALFVAALWSAFFAALALVGGVWWSVHAWAGAIALATLLAVGVTFALDADA